MYYFLIITKLVTHHNTNTHNFYRKTCNSSQYKYSQLLLIKLAYLQNISVKESMYYLLIIAKLVTSNQTCLYLKSINFFF